MNGFFPDLADQILFTAFAYRLWFLDVFQINSWLEKCRKEVNSDEAPENIEATQRIIEQCEQQLEPALQLCANTVSEGQRLLQDLRNSGMNMETDNTGSFEALEAAMRTLERQRNELEELWESRKLKLDLCLQLRLFERDALDVSPKCDIILNRILHRTSLQGIPMFLFLTDDAAVGHLARETPTG